MPPATPVKFSALPEVVRNKFVEAGCPIQLQCEVSEPSAQVYWHKDGDQLPPQSEYEIQTKENLRALLIKCAEVRHSGLYSCEAKDDHIEFKVDVAGDLCNLIVRSRTLLCKMTQSDTCFLTLVPLQNVGIWFRLLFLVQLRISEP